MKNTEEEVLHGFSIELEEVLSVYWNHLRKYSLHTIRLQEFILYIALKQELHHDYTLLFVLSICTLCIIYVSRIHGLCLLNSFLGLLTLNMMDYLQKLIMSSNIVEAIFKFLYLYYDNMVYFFTMQTNFIFNQIVMLYYNNSEGKHPNSK